MPATRRTSSGPAKRNGQGTLSFNSKITKSIPTPATKGKINAIHTSTISTPKSKDAGDVRPAAVVVAPVQEEPKPIIRERTAEEKRAESMSEAAIKKFWKAREQDRLAKRVHQEKISLEEKILRLFDMSSQYGPAIGIPRLRRWTRAQKLNLQPPIEVLAVLLREEKRGNKGAERAYVDEIMEGRTSVEV